MSPTSLLLFLCASFSGIAAIAPDVQAEEGCSPKTCGNLNISAPFGLVNGSEENRCGQVGFQVQCTDDVPYLAYYGRAFGLQILGIFYGNFSLLVSDVHKLRDFDPTGCHVPNADTASKLGQPFSISDLNQNLVFYNCTKPPPPPETVSRDGLVETVCRNNTFVRAGGPYNETGVGVGGYELEGCNSTVVPVLGKSGRVNASDYLELIRNNGFLLTWQPPQGPQPHDAGKLTRQIIFGAARPTSCVGSVALCKELEYDATIFLT